MSIFGNTRISCFSGKSRKTRKTFFAGQRKVQIERARVNLVFLDFLENQNFLKKRVSFLAPKERTKKKVHKKKCIKKVHKKVYKKKSVQKKSVQKKCML